MVMTHLKIQEKVRRSYLRLARAICNSLNKEIEFGRLSSSRNNAWVEYSKGYLKFEMSQFAFIKTALDCIVLHYESNDSSILHKSRIIQSIEKLLLRKDNNKEKKRQSASTLVNRQGKGIYRGLSKWSGTRYGCR